MKGFTGTVKTLAPVVKAVLKREELEMLAREIQSVDFDLRRLNIHVSDIVAIDHANYRMT